MLSFLNKKPKKTSGDIQKSLLTDEDKRLSIGQTNNLDIHARIREATQKKVKNQLFVDLLDKLQNLHMAEKRDYSALAGCFASLSKNELFIGQQKKEALNETSTKDIFNLTSTHTLLMDKNLEHSRDETVVRFNQACSSIESSAEENIRQANASIQYWTDELKKPAPTPQQTKSATACGR